MKYTKSILRFLCTFGIIIFLVILPFISEGYTKQHFFENNYYTLIAGVVGGIITLYALVLQFQHERTRSHEEKIISARCFFKVNYVNGSQAGKKIDVYKCRTSSKENDAKANFCLTLQLKSSAFVYDCNVNINMESIIHVCLGVVVPEQFIAVPIADVNKKFSIEITYKTQMNERLVHTLFFDDISTGMAEESVYFYRDGKRQELLHCMSQIFCLNVEESIYD